VDDQGRSEGGESIFKFASRRMGWYGTNPVAELEDAERPRVGGAAKRRIFTAEELQETIANAPEPFQTLFAFAAVTGARLSECLGFTWPDLDVKDLAQASVSFVAQVNRRGVRQPLKTQESARMVELPRQLAAALLRHKLRTADTCPGGFVFASRSGRPLMQCNVARALRAAQRRADRRVRPADVPRLAPGG
jgi:integrase